MAIGRQKKLNEGGYRAFTIRTPVEIYKAIDDYAWERRISIGMAVSQLIPKALAIENGGKADAEKTSEAENAN